MATNKFTFDKDHGYGELKKLFATKPAHVFVGVLKEAGMHRAPVEKYGPPKPGARQKYGPPAPPITVAQIAMIHEFGSSDGKHPPQRSFIGATLDEKQAVISTTIAKLCSKVVSGQMKEGQALGLLGQMVKDQIRAKITAGLQPALARSTLLKKGAQKYRPLIDTGQLLASIGFEVRKRK